MFSGAINMYGLIFSLILLALAASPTAIAQSTFPAPGQPPVQKTSGWGFDLKAEDKSVRPGDNFFLYANGSYIRNIEIPANRTSFGLLSNMNELTEATMHRLLEDELAQPGPTRAEQKVVAFYKAFMDEERVEAVGTGPLKVDLDRVRAIKSLSDMSRYMGSSSSGFGSSILRMEVIADSEDTTRYILELSQSGLGLPGRQYYLKPELAATKQKYEAHVARMLELAGWPDASQLAARVVAFETQLATVSWSEEEDRDARKTYHPVSLEELEKAAPGVDIVGFLDAASFGGERRFDIKESSAIRGLAETFAKTPLSTLKAWQAFHVTAQASDLLPQRFVEAEFEFRGRVLHGQPTLEPRWNRAIEAEDRRLGEAVGQIYVAHSFLPESKRQMEELVANLKAAFHDRLEHATWMSEGTRAEALKKLDTMSVGIGYPSRWKTYDFDVSSTDLYGDVKRSIAWSHAQSVLRLHQPVDREAWELLPQSGGSEYDPSINRITFPAANLQFPFFDQNADPAVNYGAIGVVIGHEITHGFDDQGRQIDSGGLLRDWWTAEDARKFKVQAERLSQQYSAFEPLPGVHVNGALTLGEDLADTGGMALALDAYHRSLGGAPAPVLDGTTGDQRFFLSCAQVWAGKTREESIRRQLTNNPHPPGEQRVNGEVRNLDAWYAAFDVKPGDKLYISPEDRVHIW
jgi:putative endopeptidase